MSSIQHQTLFSFAGGPRALAVGAAVLGLSLLQACGGGGSSDAADPEPVKPLTYDLQVAMSQYYTKAQSWTLSGTIGPTAVSAVMSLTPKTGTLAFPVNGKAYAYTGQEMKVSAAGQTVTSSSELFFDPALLQTEASASRADDACESTAVKGSLSRAAKVGDSGANGSGSEHVSCAVGAAVEANFVDTWQVKEEAGRVLLCLNRSSKVVATGFTRTGSECHQLLADGSLGTFMSVTGTYEEGALSLKTQ